MANVIDVVTRFRTEAIDQLKQQQDAVEGMRQSLLGNITAANLLSNAIQQLASQAVQQFQAMVSEVEQLGRVAKATGATIQELSLIRQVFEEAGVSAEAATPAIRIFSKALQDGSLAQYGVTATGLVEGLKQLGAAFSGMADGPEKLNLATQALGRNSVDLVSVIEELATNQRLVNDIMRSGAVYTEQQANALKKVDSALDVLGRNIKASWHEFGAGIAKNLEPLIQQLNRLFDAARRASDVAKLNRGEPIAGMEVTAKAPFVGPPAPIAELKKAAEVAEQLRDKMQKAAEAAAKLRQNLANIRTIYGTSAGDIGGMRPRGGASPLKPGEEVPVPDLKWGEAAEKLMRLQEIANSVGMTVVNAFSQVSVAVFNGAMSFGQAVKQVFKSMVDAIIAELARLAAIKLFKFVLNLVMPGSGDAFEGFASGARAGRAPIGANAMTGGNTYIVQTYDSMSALAALTSPGGYLRGANDRLAVMGATP